MGTYCNFKKWDFDICWQHMEIQIQKDLQLYEEREIESTFLEIIEPNKKNKIIDYVYKHSNLPVTELTKMIT